jgi:hypothetical protein
MLLHLWDLHNKVGVFTWFSLKIHAVLWMRVIGFVYMEIGIDADGLSLPFFRCRTLFVPLLI